ncbi:hypothetical protein L6452_21153 [Arctium lappa]|uniref:Uncharacterized protein n=1 Tax=Arctium lappa TaxID=4217 RepID=A0ACB9BE55_ARCLA|nr:hypothetical protein L6452_21153 [Arctium lappa]
MKAEVMARSRGGQVDSLLIDPSLLIDYHSLSVNTTLSFGDLASSERAKGQALLMSMGIVQGFKDFDADWWLYAAEL